MSEQTFEKLNNIEKTVKITPINYQAQLADGSLTTCKGCVQLNTKIDDKLLPITFILVPALNFDILLGMSFIINSRLKSKAQTMELVLSFLIEDITPLKK